MWFKLNTCVDREMSAQQQKQMRTEYLVRYH